MTAAGLVLVLGCVLGQTPATLPAKDYPTDWPPLPDFKTRIDYVAWYVERANKGITPENDAAPLWDEITRAENDPDEVKQAKGRMWGADDHWGVPGLFTGDDPTPERYAWDPADHPEWEKAYDLQCKWGLHKKLIDISKRSRCLLPAPKWERNELETKVGFTENDRLLYHMLFPSLSVRRAGVKVLLQNAWRMEEGQVDAEAMFEAVKAGLRIAHQLESGNHAPINTLVAQGLRSLVYRNILKALEESVFDMRQLDKLLCWLRLSDSEPVEWTGIIPGEMAQQLDILQFACWPAEGDVSRVPEPNMRNVAKIQRYLNLFYQKYPELHRDPLDIEQEIHKCGAQEGLRQIVAFWSEARTLVKHPIPRIAMTSARELCGVFRRDPETHVLLRQFAQEHLEVYIWIGACTEASRRATQLICAIHHTKQKSGEWPRLLRLTRPSVSTRIRTDPFSGRYFNYRIEDGQPLLYSAGFNGKDDGGNHDVRWGWWGEESRNTDYVFWPIPKKDE